eukprot:scaffold50685_cov70-Phaeocystis_antarctica.AAC.3
MPTLSRCPCRASMKPRKSPMIASRRLAWRIRWIGRAAAAMPSAAIAAAVATDRADHAMHDWSAAKSPARPAEASCWYVSRKDA